MQNPLGTLDPLDAALNDAGAAYSMKQQEQRAAEERRKLVVAAIHDAIRPLMPRILELPMGGYADGSGICKTVREFNNEEREGGILRDDGVRISYYHGAVISLVIYVQTAGIHVGTELYHAPTMPLETPPSEVVAAYCKLLAKHVRHDLLRKA